MESGELQEIGGSGTDDQRALLHAGFAAEVIDVLRSHSTPVLSDLTVERTLSQQAQHRALSLGPNFRPNERSLNVNTHPPVDKPTLLDILQRVSGPDRFSVFAIS